MKLVLLLATVAASQNVLASPKSLATERELSLAHCNNFEEFTLNFISGPLRHLTNMVVTKILHLLPSSAGSCLFASGSCLNLASFPRKSHIENKKVLFVTALDTLKQRNLKLSCGAKSRKWGLQFSMAMDKVGIAMEDTQTRAVDTCTGRENCSVFTENQMITVSARFGCSADKMQIGLKFDTLEFDEPVLYQDACGEKTNLTPVVQDAIRHATDSVKYTCPDHFVARHLCHAACSLLM